LTQEGSDKTASRRRQDGALDIQRLVEIDGRKRDGGERPRHHRGSFVFSFVRVYFLLLTCGSILGFSGLQQAFFPGLQHAFHVEKKE
jgi:hypothetical protein